MIPIYNHKDKKQPIQLEHKVVPIRTHRPFFGLFFVFILAGGLLV